MMILLVQNKFVEITNHMNEGLLRNTSLKKNLKLIPTNCKNNKRIQDLLVQYAYCVIWIGWLMNPKLAGI